MEKVTKPGAEEVAEETAFFTVVFEGDIRKLAGNPLRYTTSFGPVVAAGVGNAFAEIDRLSDSTPPPKDSLRGGGE